MVQTTINILDLIVFGIVGLSALLSFFRGFVREVLSLGAWVGAAVITLYAFPHVAAMLEPHVGSTMVASGFAALFTFMATLIILSVLGGLVLKFLKPGADVGVLDNGMGLIFGVARGVLLVAVGWFLFSLAVAEKDYPDWVRGSVSLPYVKSAAEWVARIAPSYVEDIAPGSKGDGKTAKEVVDEAKEKQQELREEAEEKTDNWPTMDDLRDRMDDVTGGGY